MNVEPPPVFENVPEVPAPEDPPFLQDVSNAIEYITVTALKNREVGNRLALGVRVSNCFYSGFNPGSSTMDDLAVAYTYKLTVISARAGARVSTIT